MGVNSTAPGGTVIHIVGSQQDDSCLESQYGQGLSMWSAPPPPPPPGSPHTVQRLELG